MNEYFQIPDFCPECNSSLTQEGQFLYCRSKACPSKLSGAVSVWVEKLGLLFWGDSLINKLTDQNNPNVSSIADLYRLSIDDISKCCSGKKVAEKCYKQLHDQKSVPLQLLLSALNIQLLGIATATDIVSCGLNTVDKVISASIDDFARVQNIGNKTADIIYHGIQDKKDIIIDLSTVLNIISDVPGPLSNLSFCITGALTKPRKTVEKIIMDAGGIVKGTVGVGLSYLVTNDNNTTSSKMKKATQHGVRVISESDLYSMCGRS